MFSTGMGKISLFSYCHLFLHLTHFCLPLLPPLSPGVTALSVLDKGRQAGNKQPLCHPRREETDYVEVDEDAR